MYCIYIDYFINIIYPLGSAIPPRGWSVGQLVRLGGRGAERAGEQRGRGRKQGARGKNWGRSAAVERDPPIADFTWDWLVENLGAVRRRSAVERDPQIADCIGDWLENLGAVRQSSAAERDPQIADYIWDWLKHWWQRLNFWGLRVRISFRGSIS